MRDEIRSNAQEFISFLGTCMYFYEHNLTPYEQSHVMYEAGMLMRDYLSPTNRNKLIAVLRKGIHENPAFYVDTDSVDVNAVREAYHTGQTHAVMRDYKDFRDDPEMGGETDGKDGV